MAKDPQSEAVVLESDVDQYHVLAIEDGVVVSLSQDSRQDFAGMFLVEIVKIYREIVLVAFGEPPTTKHGSDIAAWLKDEVIGALYILVPPLRISLEKRKRDGRGMVLVSAVEVLH